MKKFLLVIGFILLLMVGTSFAFSLNVPSRTISVPAGGAKEVQINITSQKVDDIVFSFSDSKTWVSMDIQHTVLNVSETKYMKVFISPPISIQLGLYRVGIIAESLTTDEKEERDLYINVERGERIYIEKITATGKLEPAGYVDIETYLKNYMKTTVQDIAMRMIVYSPKGEILDYGTTINKLDPMESKVVGKTIYFNKSADSGTYFIDVLITYLDEKETLEQTFTVVERSIMSTTHEKFSLLLGYGQTIKVRNDGNEIGNETVIEDISGFDAIFFSGDEPSKKIDGKYFWDFSDMEPAEERSITYQVDYSPLFLFILAVIVAWWYFFYKYRTLRIRKFIMQRKYIKEGEEFTVGIELHNGLGKKMKELTIRDFVPPIFKIKPGAGPAPKMKTTNIGTELIWKLSDLKRREDRILSYKITPMFGVHGVISLPSAYAEFTFNKMKAKNMSNITKLGVRETNKEKTSRFSLARGKKK